MADYNTAPIAAQIRPPQVMSLSDMMNFSRAAQQYRQSEQMNPLLLQGQQQEVARGGISLEQETQKNQERLALQKMMQETPYVVMTNGMFDPEKLNRIVPKLAPYTGQDFISKYTTLGTAQNNLMDSATKLNQDDRSVIAGPLAMLGRLKVTDPKVYINELDVLKNQYQNNPNAIRLIEAQKTIISQMQPGEHLAEGAIRASQSLLNPAQQQTTFAPTISTQEGRTTITTPSIGANLPSATVGTAGGLQQGGPKELPTAGSEVAPGMRIPYPVRSAAQPFIPEPAEAADITAGTTYRNNLVNRQTALSTNRRNVEETIGQAQKIYNDLYFPKGGLIGDVERKIKMAMEGEEYKQLAKDLAVLQMSNLGAMGQGGSTVAGIDLTKVASGDITVPPAVLIKIARRTQSDMTNLDMQAQGAQQFQQRFGDNNMKAYQQAWNANADSKIFEAINLSKDITDPAQLKTELDKLFPSKAKHDEFLKKYRNLKRLSETGTQ
jgi:hypothetical protein